MEAECHNCGHPFYGQEKFCPDCGQKNKDRKITFKSFIAEVFNGFISWDAKFWKTLFPLLTKPGKVSRDFIDGKRVRYSNPFQFYLTTSILFFLLFGAIESYNKFTELSEGSSNKETTTSLTQSVKSKKIDSKNIDSLRNVVNNSLKNSFIPFDSIQRKKIIDNIDLEKDSVLINNGGTNINFGGTRIDKFSKFHRKNPNVAVDVALDSLGYEKTFMNRFLYDRAKVTTTFNNKENRQKFVNQMISYASVSLFILLPIFTLFLRFFYIRRKFTYVEHLIFVFHTQTVFFLLLILFTILNFFTDVVEQWIFILLFLIYLFLAMKKFYKQGYFKTFLKFILLNSVYMFLALIGLVFVALTSFIFF